MFTTIQQLRTQYQSIGHGPPLVLLHGWGCDWQIWYPVIQELSATHQLIIPDLPGFGQSDTPPLHWNSTHYTEWLRAFIQESTQGKPYTLVGHSFGGKLAACLAAGESVQATNLQQLVLVDASGLPDPLLLSKRLQQTILRLIPAGLKATLPTAFKRRLLEKTGSALDHFQATPAQRQILKNIVRENIAPKLPRITVPTLLIWGAQDQDTPLHQGEQFDHAIPDSRLVTFSQSQHFPFITETEQFIVTLESFLHRAT